MSRFASKQVRKCDGLPSSISSKYQISCNLFSLCIFFCCVCNRYHMNNGNSISLRIFFRYNTSVALIKWERNNSLFEMLKAAQRTRDTAAMYVVHKKRQRNNVKKTSETENSLNSTLYCVRDIRETIVGENIANTTCVCSSRFQFTTLS